MPEAQTEAEARHRSLYVLNSTPVVACKADPRFSYCLYAPPTLGSVEQCPELVVVMHGTQRTFMEYRKMFSDFARWNNCVVLAPLFPAGVLGDDNRDGFKYLREGNIRYDQVLLAMVSEVADRLNQTFRKFALFGYSGGGHFAHRFLMLHPERLWAVSIGAPGSVTLLDADRDWWVGTRNIEAIFGKEPDVTSMARVPVHMVVGAADLETWEITHKPGGRNWMPDANHAGTNRPERLDALRRSFEAHRIPVQFDLVPNMAHDGGPAVAKAQTFFAATLADLRSNRIL